MLSCTSQKTEKWTNFKSKFIEEYNCLNIPPLQLSYQQNIKGIKDLDSINIQNAFFVNIKERLSTIDVNNLSIKEQLDYDLIQYETDLNLERLHLEKQWKSAIADSISSRGLSTLKNGKEWYTYFLKKWVDKEATPDKIYAFGLKEIDRVKRNMKSIQMQSRMDSSTFQKYIRSPHFYFTDVDSIQLAFEKLKTEIGTTASLYFPDVDKISPLIIKKGTEKRMAIAPAYYMDTQQTFYYNYFDTPYNKRQIAWIYLHEGVPGHHYQIDLEKKTNRTALQKKFEYYGFIEGYAAYVEELGVTLGAYKTMYDELGKWEWDLIRSVRVSMDVGLNYYNWTDEEALLFWQKHIPGQDNIAQREIARMKRWPAQVVTYKYGGSKILEWKEKAEKKEGFSLLNFHEKLLQFGNTPFSILEKYIDLE